MRHLTFVLLLAFPLGAVASAADAPSALTAAKGKKKRSKKSKRKKARRARKVKEEARKAQKEAEERTAPAQFRWTARPSGQDMDARADQKRNEAIDKLKKLLPTVAVGPQKAELTFRLSEMYWAKSKFLHLRAMQIWDGQLETWHRGGGKGREPKLQAIRETDESGVYRRQALGIYDEILKGYPRYHRKDEVLYNLGSSLYESGQKNAGVGKYWDLIKQFPNSVFAADSWLQLGEHFFNSNQLSKAVKAYQHAAEGKKPRIYSFALYKLAWCDFNLQEYAHALQKFRGVVAYSKQQRAGDVAKGEMAERDRIQLMGEALSDMVRTYSHLDAVDDAFEFYIEEVGEEKAYKYLHRLASLYDKEGKYALEIRSYQRLNADYPYRPEAPNNQTAVMKAFAHLGKNDRVRQEVRRLVDLYSPNGVWAQSNAEKDEVLDGAFEVVESELAALVTEQHRAAQQTNLVQTYQLARDIYKEYLDKFTTSINSYKFRFLYAEILFELKEFGKAAAQYDNVVEANDKGEFVKPAAYTAVLAWEKLAAGVKETLGRRIVEGKRGKSRGALKRLEEIKTLNKGEEYAETPLTDVEQKLARACDTFVRVAPNDDEVLKVKFKSARLHFIHNQFVEAANRFGEIIDKSPNDRLARIGAESILQSFNARQDWSNLNKWSRKFSSNRPLMADKGFRKKVGEFIEGASFNEVHFVYEPKGNTLETADRYSRFVEEFPKSKFAMVALYNAVVNYDKSNLLEKAIARAQTLVVSYKDFKISKADIDKSKREGSQLPKPEQLREKVLFLKASFHERIAEFGIAADLYEQYAKEFTKGPKVADSVFNAALYREGLGDFDRAIANLETYVREFPRKRDIPDIAWRIGLIREKKKDWSGVDRHFAAWGKKHGSSDPARRLCADYKRVKAMLARKKEGEARAGYAGLIARYRKLSGARKQQPCALDAAALAAFELVETDFDAYTAIRLEGKEKQINERLIKKMKMVGDLQGRYTKVLELGQGDYGIAALYRIGQIYQQLAQQMFATACPKRLTGDQCVIYEAALQEQAFPLEEKAIEAYDMALAKAYELGLYNDWLGKTQEALKVFEPTRFPEIRQYELIAAETVSKVPELVEVRP